MTTTTSRSSSPPTSARPTAAAERRRARGPVREPDALRRAACAGDRTARARPDARPRALPGGEASSARRPSRDRCGEAVRAIGGRTGVRRRARHDRGARSPQRRVRSAARLSLRGLRQPPSQARDPRGVASADRPCDGRGARNRTRRARLDCRGPMAASVDPSLVDWLDLVFRWFHVAAAIVWIGTSFYFVALDSHLLPPEDERDRERGVGGETWEIHGGGFYRVEKLRVAPHTLPEPLHWFKWEAYWTWLSGFALFTVLYYLQPHTYLIDSSVAKLSSAEAIGASIGLLVAAWFVYDALCRTVAKRSEAALAACMLVLVAGTAYGVAHLFSARA